MSTILARFKRGEDRVKLIRDLDPDFYYALSDLVGEPGTRLEHLKKDGYLDVCELYEAHGYTRLALCRACEGTGTRWYRDRHGDADKDICEACQGEGGTGPPDREDASVARRPSGEGA